jgi:hypothetical protein
MHVAVRSRNAVEWRLARDKSERVNQYAKCHLNAKNAGNATADTTITNNGENFVCSRRFRLSCAAVPTRKGSVAFLTGNCDGQTPQIVLPRSIKDMVITLYLCA